MIGANAIEAPVAAAPHGAEAAHGSPQARRHEPRTALCGCGGLLRGCFPVTLLDMSIGGLGLETRTGLRPGASYELTANVADSRLVARVLIRRCAAASTVSDGNGGRAVVYRSGASFVDLEAEQRVAVVVLLARLDRAAARGAYAGDASGTGGRPASAVPRAGERRPVGESAPAVYAHLAPE